MTTPISRIPWPDAARGMAIILVVFHHGVIYSYAEGLADEFWVIGTEFLRTMRMPLFFMAAGLFATKWINGAWRPLFRSKVMLLAWVFALWVVIRWVILNLIPGVDSETGLLQLPLHMFWPVGGWFLFALGIFFVLARLLRPVPPLIQLVGAGAISAAWFAFEAGNILGNNGWDGIPLYFFFFLLGALARSPILAAADHITIVSGMGIVAAWAASYFTLAAFDLADAPGVSFLLRLLGLAAGIVLAVTLQQISWLRSLGSATLPIYVSHSLFIFAAVWAASLVVTPTPMSNWVVPIVMAAVGLGGGYLTGWTAPRLHGGWLFAPPRWLGRAFDRVWPIKDGAIR